MVIDADTRKQGQDQTSLTRSVIVTLACAMGAFWLLSETITFYYRHSKAEAEVRENLTNELNDVAAEESRRFELAHIRVNTLLRLSSLWGELHRSPRLSQTQGSTLQHTKFVPFEGVQVDEQLIAGAGQLLEVFGDSDPVNRAETFLLVPGQGIFLYRPTAQMPANMQTRMHALLSRQYPSTTSDNNWGEVFVDDEGHLHSAVTAVDVHTGTIAGQLLRIDELNTRNYNFSYILRDDAGTLLWLDDRTESALLAARELRPNCQREAREVTGFIVDCTVLSGPPWQLSAIAVGNTAMARGLPLLSLTASWTLLAHLMLLAVIALTLQRQLGRPLTHIVELIHRQKQLTELNFQLPEGRKDELGRIASGFNDMLKTLHTYHQRLEDKVRRRTRELDAAKRIAERANHRKSEHLTSISHEIRTPLNGILGALSLLERSTLSEAQQDLIANARQSSEFLLSIISNLLDFSRIEAGQLELCYEQTAILPIIDQALLTINIRAQEKHLSLSTLVAANVPRSMSLDRVRVQQILINLLANAVKFTAQGEICVYLERMGEVLLISVRDTGKGIPEKNQVDIFLPFIQVRTNDSGSGLGLAITFQLASLMGGKVLLDSQVGRGSTFTLVLPICNPGEPLSATPARLPAPLALQPQLAIWGIEGLPGDSPLLDMPELVYLPGRLWQKVSTILSEEKMPVEEPASIARCAWSLKVLVVDDTQVNRDIVSKMLRELGHLVYLASSGEEALRLGREHVFDWVLLDIRMPDMDGLQVTRLWRDPENGMLDLGTPIMALTANALPTERFRALAAGMNGYLAKPTSLEQLASWVAQVVSQQLVRGLDLAPNRNLQQPLLDLAAPMLRISFYETLEAVHRDIQIACGKRDRASLLMSLHTLKGFAGQSGLEQLYKWALDQETCLSQGGWLNDEELRDLYRLILCKVS